ncbi:MAG: L-serine ammonia-lyase, iron-sulfur-dependent subunit beta [Eubacteriaceae bacterium]|jgi:L-serine dehydratase|nr:L-serine ammonia-lyase, iron-sulfur-dependent subunit beta [Eubacteriaceae bacterium]
MASSVFDIVGPVMVGPSSSHTLGAVRLGSFVRQFASSGIRQCTVTLYGSFAMTYKGHRTDIAIVGGLIGMRYDDEALRNAFKLAELMSFDCSFKIDSSGEHAGNVASFDFETQEGEKHAVFGESVGGGRINIFEIDGMRVDISGEYHTLITVHRDIFGMLAKIALALADVQVNIAFLKLYREEKNETAILVAQTDEETPASALEKIRSLEHVFSATAVNPLR